METLIRFSQRKGLIIVINYSKTNTKSCLSLHYNAGNSYLFNFPTKFCLISISNVFNATESREVSLNGNMHDFSVDYNSMDKSDILNIHRYLPTKNSVK